MTAGKGSSKGSPRERPKGESQALSELLGCSHDSVILCDRDGAITYWNSGSERIYGWTKKEALGRNIHQLLRTTFPPNTMSTPPRCYCRRFKPSSRQTRP